MAKKTRIKEIAEYLNLSSATVSMVLNDRPGISSETRERVLDAVRKLDYRPTSIKRALKGMAGVLPFIVYRKHGQVIAETPFFSSLSAAIENEARSHGYQLSIHYLSAQTDDLDTEFHAICSGTDTGIIILATEMNRHNCQTILKHNIPCVLIDNAMPSIHANKVLMNNYSGAWQAVEQFYQKGHRRIGYLHSSVWIHNFDERCVGFRRAMQEFGLTVNERWIYNLHPTQEKAYRDMMRHCQGSNDYPSAFFADNDIIAIGAMKALKENHLAIPADVSIIGFDNMPFCTVIEPNLSSLNVDISAIAAQAVRMLLTKDSSTQTILVDPLYIERQSVCTLSASPSQNAF